MNTIIDAILHCLADMVTVNGYEYAEDMRWERWTLQFNDVGKHIYLFYHRSCDPHDDEQPLSLSWFDHRHAHIGWDFDLEAPDSLEKLREMVKFAKEDVVAARD